MRATFFDRVGRRSGEQPRVALSLFSSPLVSLVMCRLVVPCVVKNFGSIVEITSSGTSNPALPLSIWDMPAKRVR